MDNKNIIQIGQEGKRYVMARARCEQTERPEVPQYLDARLSWAFLVRGFISMISKVKMQEKIQRLKFHDFNICPYILHADTDADADAWGIAIALLH